MTTNTGAAEMAPLKRSSLRDDATRTLRSQIVAGTILPGRLYAMGDIATKLGTSPTPVREALLELENQGLVELVRNRGFRVREISKDDLVEILDMRLMLEVPALQRLAAMPVQLDLSEAYRLCDLTMEMARSGNVMAFLAIDRDFHLSLISKIGNVRLTAFVGTLRDQTRLYGIAHLDKDGLESSAAEHYAILDAIKNHNVEQVTKLLTVHLGHVTAEWAQES